MWDVVRKRSAIESSPERSISTGSYKRKYGRGPEIAPEAG